MKLNGHFFVAVIVWCAFASPHAQMSAQQGVAPPEAAAVNSEATLHYIHGSWDSLTRSMTSCESLADVKVRDSAGAQAVLYLPADVPATLKVLVMEQSCKVRIIQLPRRIEKLGDVRPEELHTPGLLYLPNPYVVPGGRFNEMYGWDSYFILLGLEADQFSV